jgi:hypothetical protein
MAIPDSVPKTPEGYIKYLESQITRAAEHWMHYGWAVSGAYADAYELQLRTLGKVKRAQEARKTAEHAFVNFCFSLLTVGVAGGVAGALARKMFTDAAGKKNDTAIDAMKQVLQRGQQQKAYDPVMEALNPSTKTADDVFAPVGPTPAQYTAKLMEGITDKTSLLRDILDEVQWSRISTGVKFEGNVIPLKSSGDKLTAADAKYLVDAILNSSFMKEMPPQNVRSRDLTSKAALALWIGWAYARDDDYWGNSRWQQPIIGTVTATEAYNEQFEWEPVRVDLLGLGVPGPQITTVGTDYGWMGKTKPMNGLWMWGFMKWASSPAAVDTLFAGLPRNAEGFETVKQQMTKRRLTDAGWVEIKPPPEANQSTRLQVPPSLILTNSSRSP